MSGAPMVKLDAAALGDFAAKTGQVLSEISTPISGVGNVNNALDWKVKSQADIEEKLLAMQRKLRDQESKLNSMNAVISNGSEKLEEATAKLNARTAAIAMNVGAISNSEGGQWSDGSDTNNSNDLWKNIDINKWLSLPCVFIGDLYTSVKDYFSNLFSKNKNQNGDSGGGHSGNGRHDGNNGGVVDEFNQTVYERRDGKLVVYDSNGNPRVMTKEEYEADLAEKRKEEERKREEEERRIEQERQNRKEKNSEDLKKLTDNLYKKDYVGNCTNLLNDQLKAQGIYLGSAKNEKKTATHMGKSYVRKQFATFTKDKASENGGYYCDTYLCDYNTSGDERAKFNEMLNNNPEPITNIVLSFSPGSKFHVDDIQGHAMTISKIEDGMVYFTDNLRGNGPLTKSPEPNGTGGKPFYGNACCMTIEAFESFYLDRLNCNGIAVIKHI